MLCRLVVSRRSPRSTPVQVCGWQARRSGVSLEEVLDITRGTLLVCSLALSTPLGENKECRPKKLKEAARAGCQPRDQLNTFVTCSKSNIRCFVGTVVQLLW